GAGTEMPTCPLCNSELHRDDIRLPLFDCRQCGRKLQPVRSRAYLWTRFLICTGAATAYAWTHGFPGSFVIFVVSLYAIPALLIWSAVERAFFPPPKRFKPYPSPVFQTLGLD